MRSISRQGVGGERASSQNRALRAVLVLVECIVEVGEFFANYPNARLSRNRFRDSPRKFDAVDSQRVACWYSRCIRKTQESGSSAAHLLLQQPGRCVGRLALERVGADQLSEISRLVSWGKPRFSVDHGAHLVKVDLAAMAGRGERSLRAGQSASNHANLHFAFP